MCSHRHGDSVDLPDGITVWGASFPAAGYERDSPPDFGLYLDASWTPPWPHTHIDWVDFGLPEDDAVMRRALHDVLKRAKAGQTVEIGCLGGHGRTGSALACLAVLTGLAEDPVAWVREHYCQYAVETDEQAAFVRDFERVP